MEHVTPSRIGIAPLMNGIRHDTPGRCHCTSACPVCACGNHTAREQAPVPHAGNEPSFGLKDRRSMPATRLLPEQPARIVTIRGDAGIVRRLADLGLTPGTTIRVLQRIPLDGPVEVMVRRTRLAIDAVIAEKIYVEFSGESPS